MSTQNLIIYKFNELYQILEELSLDLNFNFIAADNEKALNEKTKKIRNYLIISNKNDDVQKHHEILNINYWIDLIRNNEAVLNQNSESIQSDYEEVILNYRKMKSKEDSQKKLYTFVRKLHNKIFNIFINILKIYT